MSSQDNPTRRIALENVMQLCHCDVQQAEFLLDCCNEDVNAAVQMYYEQIHNAPPAQPSQTRRVPDLPPRPRAPASTVSQPASAPASAPVHPEPAHESVVTRVVPAVIGAAVRIPFFLLRASFMMLAQSMALGLGVAAFVGDRVLPRLVMRHIRGAASNLIGHNDMPAQQQAETFIREYKDAYGDVHPRWLSTDLKSACATARTQFKFLMVYLHSPQHQDTPDFCGTVLRDLDLVTYVNDHMLCWGGDIRRSDAHALSIRLGATKYPFVAVISMAHNVNQATLLQACQGRTLLQPGTLLNVLQRCVLEQGAVLVAARAEITERETTRQLLEEQDAEYEASLAADRQRQAERERERAAREQLEREAAEEEARQKAAVEAAERRKQERLDALAARRAAKLASLVPEPGPGAADLALVRVRLPNGNHAQRSFPASCHVTALFDFVDSLESTNYWKYNLVSNYPRKVFAQGDPSTQVTLLEAGLAPHAALFVQPQDEDDDSSTAA